MPSRHRAPPPSECPVCGAAVKPTARACPECGADERSGWNDDDTRYDGIDLPETSFDEEKRHEAGGEPRLKPRGLSVWWWLVGLGLLAILLSQLLPTRL